MMEAAVAWYQATGERKLLDAMLRFARHIADHIGHGEGKIPGVPGHEEIELALIRRLALKIGIEIAVRHLRPDHQINGFLRLFPQDVYKRQTSEMAFRV